MKFLSLILGFVLLSGPTWAQRSGESWVFSANFSKIDTETETENSTSSENKVTHLDWTLGYVLSSGIYVGGIYSTSSQTLDGATDDPQTTRMGVSLGYMASNGFFIQGHYFLQAKIQDAVSAGDRTHGTGTQFDLGYNVNISGPFYLGAQITRRSVEYTKVKTASGSTSQDHTVEELYPAIRLTFIF